MSAKICGTTVSYSFANATSDAVTPKTQTTVAEHAKKEELHLGGLNSSEQTDIVLGILILVTTPGAMSTLDSHRSSVLRSISTVRVCRLSMVSVRKAEAIVGQVCESHCVDFNRASAYAWTGVLLKRRRQWWQSMQKNGGSPWRFELSEEADQTEWYNLILSEDQFDEHARFSLSSSSRRGLL